MTFNQVWQSIQAMPLRSKRMLSKRLVESIKEQDDDKEYISKKEILAGIDAGLKDVKAGNGVPLDDLMRELEECKAPINNNGLMITPKLQTKINKARQEYTAENTIGVHSHEELDEYLSLR